MNKYVATIGLALAGCIVGSNASAAVNAYLTIPGVVGPSTSVAGAIDILSFSFGATSPTSRRATGANCQQLSIMKVVDVTSPTLLAHTLFGVDYPSVTVTYTKPVGAQQQTYFIITLHNASIASVEESGSNENPIESVSFQTTSYTVTYFPENPDGTLGGAVTTTLNCN
jgi:type VI protein secretion system component Hcp